MSPKFEPLDPDLYKQILEKETRYQHIGAEVAKISFAGIAVLGFFIQYVRGKGVFSSEEWILQLLGAAALAFGACVASVLLHRFFSTRGFVERVRFLQLWKSREDAPQGFSRAHDLDLAKSSTARNFRQSSRMFAAAITSCGIGGMFVMAAIVHATWFDRGATNSAFRASEHTRVGVLMLEEMATRNLTISLDASEISSEILKAAADYWSRSSASITFRNAGSLSDVERAYIVNRLGSRVTMEF